MTRTEHLQWCKDRALEYLDNGDTDAALASMVSDVMKHKDTMYHATINLLSIQMKMAGQLDTVDQMRKWINGYG